ncbi:MAG TPA: hypothetical protein VEO00_03465, partial [Actinomycetota bacterium]|nr:hypothetical protein [Actinomycetota bacterium]
MSGDRPVAGVPDHDRIDELLAGHALGALSGEDLAAAEALFAEHVPGCPDCRRTIGELEALTGDLGLAAPTRPAPDTLWASLRREIRRPLPITAPRRLRLPTWAAAAAAVAVVALGGLSATLSSRAAQAESQRAGLVDMLGFVGQ